MLQSAVMSINNPSERFPFAAEDGHKVQEAVDVSLAAQLILDPMRGADREERLVVSEMLINAIQKRPVVAETMLWPLVHSVLIEEDEEIAEHSSKALRLLHRDSPEVVEHALRVTVEECDEAAVLRSVEEVVTRLEGEREDEDPKVRELFALGRLDMRAWSRPDFVTEMVNAKRKDSNFSRYQRRDPAGAALAIERIIDSSETLYNWLNEYQGIVPHQWESARRIVKDLEYTRGSVLPPELLEAAVRHPSKKVVLAAATHHRLTPSQKAEIVRRDDIELKPDPDTFFQRREIGLHLGGPRKDGK